MEIDTHAYRMSEPQSDRTGASFTAAVVLTTVLLALVALPLLEVQLPWKLLSVGLSWYFVIPFCVVLFVLSIVLLVQGALLRGLMVLFWALALVPGTVIGVPILKAKREIEFTQLKARAIAEKERAEEDRVERAIAEDARLAQMLEASRAALEGRSLVEVEGTHGSAMRKDKETGWAVWPKFRAKFEGGKVVEVDLP